MIHSVEKIKFVTTENVSLVVQQIATAKREKNVIIKNVFFPVKMVDIVQKTAIAILMIKFALNCVFLIGIVMVAINVQMGIALCLAANQVNVPILGNTAMSKYLPQQYVYFTHIYLYVNIYIFRTSSFCHLKCKSHTNCYDDEKCIGGECQPGCSTDAHCKTGFKCFHDECKKSCQSDQTCIAGHYGTYCHIDHKVCHGACSEDADCSGGYTCFEKRCLKHCSLSKHCNYGQYCDRFVYFFIYNVLS
jgi:hypothetical protein